MKRYKKQILHLGWTVIWKYLKPVIIPGKKKLMALGVISIPAVANYLDTICNITLIDEGVFKCGPDIVNSILSNLSLYYWEYYPSFPRLMSFFEPLFGIHLSDVLSVVLAGYLLITLVHFFIILPAVITQLYLTVRGELKP